MIHFYWCQVRWCLGNHWVSWLLTVRTPPGLVWVARCRGFSLSGGAAADWAKGQARLPGPAQSRGPESPAHRRFPLHMLPTSHYAVGCWHDDTNYVVHPDFSFILALPEGYSHCFMEYERRATTPRRMRPRLENYRGYFRIGYAHRDHGGELPLLLSIFENP